MDRTPRVALDVCASLSVHATRRFFLSLMAVALLSQACQRESAIQSLEHGGSRSTAVASADTAVSNPSNFNGTAIASGRTIWFTSVFKVSGVGSSGATINVAPSKITFTAGTTPYTVNVPAAVVSIDPHATSAATSYDATSATWRTTLPLQWSGNAFLMGVSLPLTANLPGGINPVTWSAAFVTDPPGLTINWQWAAAVYTQFASDYNSLHVKPVDDPHLSAYQNSDHAGTPESYKSYVIGGARGGGGSNYTGSLSGTVSLTTHACTATCAAPTACQKPPVCHSDGTCSYQVLPDGTACDDHNANTVHDACTAGVCAGVDLCAHVTCTTSDQCHVAGICDHSTGTCSNPAASDGTACNDGNANTVNDKCTAGVCAGVDLCAHVTCTASDQCHVAGTCSHSTGTCSNPAASDGTSCNDGNANTVNDRCTAGVCGGVDLCANVTCTASDQCHVAGVCNHSTGTCSNPAASDGTACNDGNANTVSDRCTPGVCAGVDLCANVTCTASDQCHVAGTCNHSSGTCSNPAATNGTACNDGNPNTANDKCTAGVCAGVDLCANVTCTASDQCHATGTCDHATGVCSNPSVPDGTACAGGQCTAGVCVPNAPSNRAPVVSAGADQTIYLSEASPPSTLSFEMVAPFVDTSVIAPTPTGALVASPSGDLLRVSDDGTTTTLASLGQPLNALAVAPDGTIFAGGAWVGPKIFRISPDGTTIDPSWANYSSYDWPGSLLVGSDGTLYAHDGLGRWRFDANGNGTLLSPVFDGVSIVQVPRDDRYGPLSGLFITATDGQVTGVDANGNTATLALNLTGVTEIRLVPPHATFLGLDGTALWKADASSLASDFFVFTWPNGLYRVRWNGTSLQANRLYPSDVSWWAIEFRAGQASGTRTAVAQLAGSATDDGLPNPPGHLTVQWSAPAGVSIANSGLASTSATFGAAGTYTLTLTASDSELTRSADTHVTVAGVNQAPVVNAGRDVTVAIGDGANLTGSARDDGVPGGPLSYSWTMRSGPGTAAFVNASSPATHVTFDAPGSYVLQLAVSDGQSTGVDSLTVQVTTPEGLQISLSSPATVGAYVQVPYALTVTNTASVDYLGVMVDVSMPDGSSAQLALGSIPAGGSAQTTGLAFVNTTLPYWRPSWLEDVGAYLARLHALDGAPETVAAKVTATDTSGTLHVAGAATTSGIALAIVRPTMATFNPDPFVPNQAGTLTIELVNEGSLDARNVYADARSIREWKTIGIPAGQTAQLVYNAGAPFNQAGDFSVDLQTVTDEASVYWDDQFNFGYGDTLVDWNGTATVPVLEYTATAQPLTVLPSQPMTVNASVSNVGHAEAVYVSFALPNALSSLPPFAPGDLRNVGPLAATAPPVDSRSNYPTDDWYIFSLRGLRDSPLRAILLWQDIAGSQYQRSASVGSQLVVPIVSTTQTPSTAGPLYLRETLELAIDLRNEGTANALATSVQFGFDVNEGQSIVQPARLSPLLPTTTMLPGADIPVALPAALPFVPFPPSDPTNYYFWLHRAAANGLIANVVAQWSDAIGNAYGPAGQKSFISLAVPIVETELQQVQTTCTIFCTTIHVPWRLDLTSGAHNDLVFPWNASGSSTARDARITARVHGTTQVLPLPSAIQPGNSGSATLHWTAPSNPSGRQSGEAQDAYLTRLKTPITNPDARLEFIWSDDHGNVFGPISSPVSSTVPQFVIGEARPLVVVGLPGTAVQMKIDWTGGVGTADLVLHALGTAIHPAYNVHNGDFGSYDYNAPLSFPGSLPTAPARSSAGSDASYADALSALEVAPIPLTWRMTWTSNADAYGPTDGSFTGAVVLPNLTARTAVAADVGQTAQRAGVTVTNVGHAGATSAHVQFLSGNKPLRTFDLTVPAGAVAEAVF